MSTWEGKIITVSGLEPCEIPKARAWPVHSTDDEDTDTTLVYIAWSLRCGFQLDCGGSCVLAPGHVVEHECGGAFPGDGADGRPA